MLISFSDGSGVSQARAGSSTGTRAAAGPLDDDDDEYYYRVGDEYQICPPPKEYIFSLVVSAKEGCVGWG